MNITVQRTGSHLTKPPTVSCPRRPNLSARYGSDPAWLIQLLFSIEMPSDHLVFAYSAHKQGSMWDDILKGIEGICHSRSFAGRPSLNKSSLLKLTAFLAMLRKHIYFFFCILRPLVKLHKVFGGELLVLGKVYSGTGFAKELA